MKKDISTLIALQELDTELTGFDREIERKQQELTERERSIADKELHADQCRKKVMELEESRRDLKTANEEAAERIKDRQGKMMQVQTSREHQALLKEIEEAKKAVKDAEEQQLQVMEQAEAEENKAAELENLCKGERELLVEEAVKVEETIQQLNTRRTTVQNKRDKLAQELPASLMKRYDKLLKKRNGVAVVQIADSVCQGCFMTVPPQKYNDIRQGEEIHACPTCQRTLYYLPPDDEADA